MRMMIGAVVIAGLAAQARADAPTVEAVKKALPAWTGAIGVPFTYQGLRYENDDYEKAAACDKQFKSHGVIKDAKKLSRFVECLAMSGAGWAASAKADVAVFTVKGADPGMLGTLSAIQDEHTIEKGYPEKLAKLAKKGGMFISHVTKPDDVEGYWNESWNLYVAHDEGGAPKFDAIVVVPFEPSPD